MVEAVIVATARSPVGRAFKGSLKDMRAEDLTVQMVRAALDKVPALKPTDIDDLLLGCALPERSQGWNIARTIAVLLGADQLPGTTVSRFCASSLQTTRMAYHAIRAGEGEAFISAGVESVSSLAMPGGVAPAPEQIHPAFGAAMMRSDKRNTNGATWRDPRSDGRLPDVYLAMGQTAENVANQEGVTRTEQDAFALRSQNLAEEAISKGFWAADISPVRLPDHGVVATDDSPRPGVTAEQLAALRPVFRPDGTVTAGNCCPLSDGAAAVIITSDRLAQERGLTPLARIVATGVSALSPEIMGLGPVESTRKALAVAGMTIEDIDLAEINEAFAAQVIPSARRLGIEFDRLNVNGGAIAVGHPFGMTGARIISTLINSLRFHDKQVGLVTMCVGGGQGMAMILERLN